jgi:hypothetical protein
MNLILSISAIVDIPITTFIKILEAPKMQVTYKQAQLYVLFSLSYFVGKKHGRHYRQFRKGVGNVAKCLILADTNYDSKIP